MLGYEGGELRWDFSLAALVNGLATPFFLFNEAEIQRSYGALSTSFGQMASGCQIDYALKANYEPAILRVLAQLGAGAMVSRGWELELALSAGFPPERITLQGPCKTADELRHAVGRGIGLVHVSSASELRLLDRIAASERQTVRVSLRLPSPGLSLSKSVLGFYGGRLAVPWARAHDAWQLASASSWLQPVGIGTYVGTQITQPGRYVRALARMLQLARSLSCMRTQVEEITLGGGWPSGTLRPLSLKTLLAEPSPYPRRIGAPLLRQAATSVARSYLQLVERSSLPYAPVLRIESGRGLVGSAGILVSRVLAVRDRWVFIDASRNYLPESSLVGRRRILPTRMVDRDQRRHHVAGRTVNTMDVFALWTRLPAAREGDELALLDAGAYSLSRANRYGDSLPDVYLAGATGQLEKIRLGE